MAANYVLLASQTVGAAGASSVTFSNIPQTGYTDLKIVISARDADTSGALTALSFNGVTTNLSSKAIRGTGSAVNSATFASNIYIASEPGAYTANVFSSSETYIPNYTSANYKSVSDDSTGENNATASEMKLNTGLWSSTAAITSVTLTAAVSPYAQYSSFYLYGLAASGVTPVIAPFATGGNVTNDGTYWIHTFLASGTFTPLKTLSCDYLVVAGGGGGGTQGGGGGGAGGFRSTVTATGGGGSLESALSLSSGTSYTVTVGAGGSGNAGYSAGVPTVSPTSGSNSVFSTITSTGGGRAASYSLNAAAVGGSGGGGGFFSYPTGAAGTTNQGYAGGNGKATTGAPRFGGGGGGAGAVGATGSSGNGGAGGNGVATSISGSSVTYGGGGGAGGNTSAGAGGTGGGGAGQQSTAGTSGTANTGGGGGGQGDLVDGNGGAGGSGIVIIRYAMV